MDNPGSDSGWRMAARRFGPSLAVLIAGTIATLLFARLYHGARLEEVRDQFAAWCEERQQELARKIDVNIEALYGLQSLFDSSEQVTQAEFDRYTSGIVARHRDIRSLGFMSQITDDQREAFEARFSAMLKAPFQILDQVAPNTFAPAARHPDYAVLTYRQAQEVVPAGVNYRSIHTATVALDAATASGTPRATTVDRNTGPSTPTQRWVHVYLPVFSQPAAVAEPAPRKVEGFVRLRFSLDEFVKVIADQAAEAGIDMSLSEVDATTTPASVDAATAGALWDDAPALTWHGGIVIADRHWALQMQATDRYVREQQPFSGWVLLVAGLVVTLLGAMSTYFLTRSRLRTEFMSRNLADEMHERRLSEQRAVQSEERYRVLVEHSPDAILMIREGRIVFVNRAAVALFRASGAQDLLGRAAAELVHPDFRDIVLARMERLAREGVILPPLEERLLRLDGTVVDVEARSVPFVIDGETVLQITMRDITARLSAEGERRSLEIALRQSQRLEAIGTLTGGIAHDFNNILSAIVGNIGLVMDDLPQGHLARRSVHEIRAATNRARDLVKRLMTFGRQQEAPQTPLDLASLLDEVQQLLRPTLPAGVVLQVSIPPHTPPVVADATQLHQVLVNLCTNAWQAMPTNRGEIRIRVDTLSGDEARRESRTPLEGAARYLRIEVRDNGSGISPQVAEHIFEPFFTTKSAGEGTGLGLAVVHGIVRSHHGAIVLNSKEGKGTCFFVYLRASEQAVPAVPAINDERPGGANQRVLYIDDEEPLVELVKRILERHGYRCSATADPRQAIEWLEQEPHSFDLVLTDMNMPGMSGIDVAREILALRPDLPVVITTGYVRASDEVATRALGVRDLILKPDTIDELPTLVARYLRLSTAEAR